jgi:hypothetical protein
MLKFTGIVEKNDANYTNKNLNIRVFHPNKLEDIKVSVEMVKQYQTSEDIISYTYEDVTTIVDGEEVTTTVVTEVVTPLVTNHIDYINTLINYNIPTGDYNFTQIQNIVKEKLIIDYPTLTFEVI